MYLFAIVTEYSLWFLPLCLAIGAAYTWLLYANDKSFESTAVWIRRLMMAFRFIVVSVIAFFLLSPFLQSSNKTIEKPVIIIARDNSESIILNKDSSFYRTAFQQKMKELTQKLGTQFTIKELCFDSKTYDTNACNYKGKASDFEQLFSHIAARYSNYNLGAIVIASDGIYNRGASPTFAADSKEIKAPIYTIAMGDTVSPRDLAIGSVKHNQISFEGDVVPVEMQLKVNHLKNENAKITVKEGDNEVFSKTMSFSSDEQYSSIPFQLKPEKAGIHHYRIEATHLARELTYTNNSKDFVIEVLK